MGTKRETVHGVFQAGACSFELHRIDPRRRRWRRSSLRLELTGPTANVAMVGHSAAVGIDPCAMRIPQHRESLRVVIQNVQSVDCLFKPELDVGNLPNELMNVACREFLELFRNSICLIYCVHHTWTVAGSACKRQPTPTAHLSVNVLWLPPFHDEFNT